MIEQRRRERGTFDNKGEVTRKVRSIRLTDQTWAHLDEAAQQNDLDSRADLIESLYFEPKEKSELEGHTIEEIKQVIDNILSDPEITRQGKDKAAMRRGLAALVAALA